MKNIFFMLMISILLPQQLFAAATASLDRGIVSFGESVQLNIKVEGSVDQDPDFSVLQQSFDILNQSQSSNYSLINGSFKRSKQWSISLMPKQQGTLPIPAISFGNMTTSPLSLRVLAPNAQQTAQSKDIFLEVTPSATESYVQAQLIVTVKLYRAINLAQAQLSEPDMPHTIIKKLGEDKNYEVVHEQRRFVVTERQYAIFPQQSGTLTIPALQFDGRISVGNNVFNRAGKAIRIQSQTIDVNILSQPNTWQANQLWLPADSISLREIWTDKQTTTFKVGEPLTRTIEIRAKGLSAEQLPQLLTPNGNDFKQYPDQPVLNTEIHDGYVMGVRREKVALIPTKAGELALPAIVVTWWDVQSKSQQTAQIPARMITVAAADPVANMPLPTLPKSSMQPPQASHEDTSYVPNADASLWQLVSGLLALGWLITALLWWYFSYYKQDNRDKEKVVVSKPTAKIKQLHKALKQSCAQHQAAQAAELLAQWGALQLQDAQITQFSQLKGHHAELDAAIASLESHLYGKSSDTKWSGDALLQALAHLSPPAQATKTTDKSILSALYSR